MGNRAYIITEKKDIGLYLHWNGGRDSVEAFLKYCEIKGYRSPELDGYGWARLAQVIGNYLGGTLSIGIQAITSEDEENFSFTDNGAYVIKDWKIINRMGFYGKEQETHNLDEMLLQIDENFPEKEKIKMYLEAENVKVEDLRIGDKIVLVDSDGYDRNTCEEYTIMGYGDGVVNGHNTVLLPFINKFGRDLTNVEDLKNNCNNYLFDNLVYRKIR